MQRDSTIPLYAQLETILRKRIVSGEVGPGDFLPSEEALADKHKVSRITVRQALALLEQDGLIIRQRGRGTFVSDKVKKLESHKYSGFIEDMIAIGTRTKVKVLKMEMVEAFGEISKRLRLKKGGQVLRIEKVRHVKGDPFSHVVNYLRPEIGRRLESFDLSQKPLLVILEEDLGIKAAEAVQTVEAAVADAEMAPLLGVRIGDPLLKVERTVYDVDQKPVEYVSVLYRGDKYYLSIRLKRRKKSDSSFGWGSA